MLNLFHQIIMKLTLSELSVPIVGVLLVAFCCESNALAVTQSTVWDNKLDVAESGIKFQWSNTKEDQDGQRWLIMEVSAKATGYVGVGFSPNGGMIDGDMVIAWSDSDGNPVIKDFYGEMNGPPFIDESQDYDLLHFAEEEGWTTVRFKRRWNTCDNQDFAITNDTMRLIWAHSDVKPRIVNGNFVGSYHGATRRGVKSVRLLGGGAKPVFPDEAPEKFPGVKSYDMIMDKVNITLKDTYYYCKLLKFTDLEKKHHMIGWKPVIEKGNEDIVHHMILYECSVPAEDVPLFDKYYEEHPGETCFTPNMPPEWGKNCVAFSAIWVVGSEGEMLPEHVGAPLGEMHGGATYFMMEMHYENPAHRITTDSTGMRLFYTDKLRKYDGGTMLIGYRHSPFLLIPPKQENFKISGLCGSECTTKVVPETGIHITNVNAHMHLTGSRIRLRHFRDGIELPTITEDNYYDFNYQVPRMLNKEITIHKGDQFIAECEYTTHDVDKYVIGGLATHQEMCQIFFFYYPRIPLTQCTSQYEFQNFFKGLGIDEVEGKRVLKALNMPYDPRLLPPEERELDIGDDAKELELIEPGLSFNSVFNHMNITKPESLAHTESVGKYLESIKWTQEKGKLLEKFWKEGEQYQYCSKPGLKRVVLDNHLINYPKIKQEIDREPAQCKVSLLQIPVDAIPKSVMIVGAVIAAIVVLSVLVSVIYFRSRRSY